MKRQFYYNEDLEHYVEIPSRYYSHNLSSRELIEIFPEAREVIPQKIKEWQKIEEKILKNEVKPLLKRINKIEDEFSRWFWKETLKLMVNPMLAEAINNLQRLKRLEFIANYKPKKDGESKTRALEGKIEQARQTPIVNIASSFLQLQKSGKNYRALCPFHQEKHASFYIYPDTNSFYCFGCNQGGDVIKFVELAFNLDFKEAIEYLMRR